MAQMTRKLKQELTRELQRKAARETQAVLKEAWSSAKDEDPLA